MQNKNAVVAVAVVAILLVAGVSAYILARDDGGSTIPSEVTDFAGQEVVRADNLDNGVVAVGQDSFRWATYFGVADKCVMVDRNDMNNFLGKTFMYYGRALVDIEGGNSATLSDDDAARKYFTHTNCGITADDARTIIELKPSLVIVPAEFYTEHRNEMAAIESQGINTVAIGYIYTFLDQKTFNITEDLEHNINVLAKALGLEKRGDQLKSAFKMIVDDLRTISSKVTEKRTAYVGSVSYGGAHGIASSLQYFLPFELAGVTNIIGGPAEYNDSDVREYQAATIGKAIKEDTILFVDASGFANNADNTSQGLIKLFQGHDAYILAPYIWTGINYENVFVAAYQVIRCAYGDSLLTEADFKEKVNNVYDLFFGTHESNRNIAQIANNYNLPLPEKGTTIFEDMNQMYLNHPTRGNPIYGEITVNADGTMTV